MEKINEIFTLEPSCTLQKQQQQQTNITTTNLQTELMLLHSTETTWKSQ